jgi:hypothetical protein
MNEDIREGYLPHEIRGLACFEDTGGCSLAPNGHAGAQFDKTKTNLKKYS